MIFCSYHALPFYRKVRREDTLFAEFAQIIVLSLRKNVGDEKYFKPSFYED